MRIGFASTDWSHSITPPEPGGAGLYRCGLPARYLRDRGHETFHGVLARKSTRLVVKTWDENVHDDLDVIVLQRYMNPELPDDVLAARAQGQAVVNDLDDWFFGLDPTNRAFMSSHPRNTEANRNVYARILANSTALTLSTPYLSERMASQARGVPRFVLRNGINIEQWKRQEVVETARTVGWVGATPWRSGDLETLRGVLDPFLRQHGLRFQHSGALENTPTAAEQMLLGDDIDVRLKGLVQSSQVPWLYEGIDIGLVPLREAPFNFAKSCIKGLEYAAAGVPFVAQRTPEYEHFDRAMCARRPADWRRHLERLLDVNERQQQADRAWLRAWSMRMDVRAEEWERALRDIVSLTSAPVLAAKEA